MSRATQQWEKCWSFFPEGNIFVMVHFTRSFPGLSIVSTESSHLGRQNRTHQHLLHQPVLHWGCDVQIAIVLSLQVADYCTNSGKQTQNT